MCFFNSILNTLSARVGSVSYANDVQGMFVMMNHNTIVIHGLGQRLSFEARSDSVDPVIVTITGVNNIEMIWDGRENAFIVEDEETMTSCKSFILAFKTLGIDIETTINIKNITKFAGKQ